MNVFEIVLILLLAWSLSLNYRQSKFIKKRMPEIDDLRKELERIETLKKQFDDMAESRLSELRGMWRKDA